MVFTKHNNNGRNKKERVDRLREIQSLALTDPYHVHKRAEDLQLEAEYDSQPVCKVHPASGTTSSKTFRSNPVLRKQSDITTTRTDLVEEKTQSKVSASFVFFRVTCKRMYDQTAKDVGLGE
jgi:hypothetical protein